MKKKLQEMLYPGQLYFTISSLVLQITNYYTLNIDVEIFLVGYILNYLQDIH